MSIDLEQHVLPKTIDSWLRRYLIVDFKITELLDLIVYNFADVTSLKYKVSAM